MATIKTDRTRLKQIIVNLIANVLKFTEHGSVSVAVAMDPNTKTPVRLDVIDTGIGIPDDKLEKVFQAFQQQHSTTERKYGGTGLGLTISQSLCELLGYPERFAQEALGHNSKAVHRAYAKRAKMQIASLEDYERKGS